MVKWTKKVLWYTNTIMFLVKGLKLVTPIVVLNTQI